MARAASPSPPKATTCRSGERKRSLPANSRAPCSDGDAISTSTGKRSISTISAASATPFAGIATYPAASRIWPSQNTNPKSLSTIRTFFTGTNSRRRHVQFIVQTRLIDSTRFKVRRSPVMRKKSPVLQTTGSYFACSGTSARWYPAATSGGLNGVEQQLPRRRDHRVNSPAAAASPAFLTMVTGCLDVGIPKKSGPIVLNTGHERAAEKKEFRATDKHR